MMNDERKSKRLLFIIHHSSFIIRECLCGELTQLAKSLSSSKQRFVSLAETEANLLRAEFGAAVEG